MNSCFIFPLKIHWLMLFDKFLTGAMLGLGFIVAIWTVIKLIHGDEIINMGYARSEWKCSKCNHITYGKYLDRIK